MQHRDYPVAFKMAVRTIMLIRATRDNGTVPYHPDCGLWALPIELVFEIISYLAGEFCGGGVFCGVTMLSPINVGELNICDVAGGYCHQVFLSEEGEVYGIGGSSFNEVGKARATLAPGVNLNVPIPAKRVFAGYYNTVALC